MKLNLKHLMLCVALLSASLCNAQKKFGDRELFFLKGNVASVVEKSCVTDAEGNIDPEGHEQIVQISFGKDGKMAANSDIPKSDKWRAVRDEKGRLAAISTDGTMPQDGDVKDGLTFEYDEQGRLASKSEHWYNTEEDYGVTYTSYQYDEKGDVVGETIDDSSYCASGTYSKVAIKVLGTDAQGNWTKVMRTVDYTEREDEYHGVIYYIVTRTIKYY